MQKESEKDINKLPLRIITEATGYFLAGIFAVGIAIIHTSDSGVDVKISNLSLLIIGSVLILAGFTYLIAAISTKVMTIFNKYKKWIIPLLFFITSVEVLQRVFDYIDVLPLFVASIIYGSLLIYVIIRTSKTVFRDVGLLLEFCMALSIMAIIVLWTTNSLNDARWGITFILVILFGLFIWTLKIYIKQKRNANNNYDEDRVLQIWKYM